LCGSKPFVLYNVGFPQVLGGPGGFRKVWEANSDDFLLFSTKSDFMVPSYKPKPKKLNIKQATTIEL